MKFSKQVVNKIGQVSSIGGSPVHEYALKSETDRYELVRTHCDERPGVCSIAFRWRPIKSKKSTSKKSETMIIYPTFRIIDGREATGLFLLRELLSYFQYIPEKIHSYNFRAILNAIAKRYGGLAGDHRRRRCEVTIGTLAKRSMFHTPSHIHRILREAGIKRDEEHPPG